MNVRHKVSMVRPAQMISVTLHFYSVLKYILHTGTHILVYPTCRHMFCLNSMTRGVSNFGIHIEHQYVNVNPCD